MATSSDQTSFLHVFTYFTAAVHNAYTVQVNMYVIFIFVRISTTITGYSIQLLLIVQPIGSGHNVTIHKICALRVWYWTPKLSGTRCRLGDCPQDLFAGTRRFAKCHRIFSCIWRKNKNRSPSRERNDCIIVSFDQQRLGSRGADTSDGHYRTVHWNYRLFILIVLHDRTALFR